MSKIRIKNFGPIKQGVPNNDWIDIKRITVFTGNQGSGKSTVAKLISTFVWLEKALIRGDITLPIIYEEILDLFHFHRIESYLQPNTDIEYEGDTYRLTLSGDITGTGFEAIIINADSPRQPKIMYVPAERNFLSSITNISKVSNLLAGSLKNYSVEFREAQLHHKNIPIDLPINNTKIIYDANEDENFLLFNGMRIKLTDASSGFHSIVPLYWVTKYLVEFVKQHELHLLDTLSTDQTVRRNNELRNLNRLSLDETSLRIKEKKINDKYIIRYLVNIVEEPEQNLFPSSQRQLLNSLLACNSTNNVLIMTTHSPYIVNYLTLAIQGGWLKTKIENNEHVNKIALREKLNDVVPLDSCVAAADTILYELDGDGNITKLPDYEGLPTDKNELNEFLMQGNLLFDKLLEIEEELG